MNELAANPRLKRKYGFSGRNQIVGPNTPALLAFVLIVAVVAVALRCVLSDDLPPSPDPSPPAASNMR
jgi:hypothetical protein